MKRVFYEKTGRRYRPVSEYDDAVIGAMPFGAHMVVVQPNHEMRSYQIDPAHAPMVAAGMYAREAIVDAVCRASEMRPQRKPITPEQLAAWQALAKAFGDDLATLNHASAHDIAEAAVTATAAAAKDLLNNPTVKAAYEQFLLVAKLAKKQHSD